MSKCLNFGGGFGIEYDPCGLHGTCVEVENDTRIESFCLCEPGWTQSLELNFLVDKKDDLRTSICLSNRSFLNIIYVLAAVLPVISTLLDFSQLKITRKAVQRRIPWLITSILIVSLSVYRLLNPSTALLGVDFAISFMFAQTAVFASLVSYLFVSRYLQYISKRMEREAIVNNWTYYVRSGWARKGFIINISINAIFLQLLWVICFITDNETSALLFRVWVASNMARNIYKSVFYFVSLNEVSKDLRIILDSVVLQAQTEDRQSGAVLAKKVVNSQFIKWIEKRIPQVDKMKYRLTLVGIYEGFWNICALVSDFWLHAYMYILPVYLVLLQLDAFTLYLGRVNVHFCSNKDELSENSTNNRTLTVESTASSNTTMPQLSSKASKFTSQDYSGADKIEAAL